MAKRFTRCISLAVATVMMVSMVACGSSTDKATDTATDTSVAAESTTAQAEPVTYKVLTHYSTDDEKVPMDYAMAEVKKAMPNVLFEVEAQLNDNGDSLKARIATGDLPDIFNLSPNMFDAAINSQSILNLDAALVSTGLDKLYNKGVMDTQVKYTDGHCWAFPTVAGGVDLLYYNKELFAQNNVKVPTNYPELLEAVKAFSAKGIVPLPIFAKEAWPIGAYFDAFATKVNPEGMIALNNGTAKASDPGYKDAITKMAELVKAGIFQKGATSADYDTARSIFESGKAAMFINGEWEIATATEALGDKVDFIDNFPTTDPGKENDNLYAMPGAAELGGKAVSAKTKNPDEAVKVAALLTQKQADGNYIKLGRIDSPFSLDGLSPEKGLNAMTSKLQAAKPNYIIKSNVAHSLPNKKFAAGFGELLQQLVAGQSADEFIKECDKLQESSK